jgi:hypothetical protein
MPNTPDARTWLLLPPVPARTGSSSNRRSDHEMPKAQTVPVDDQVPPLLVSSIPLQPTTPP